MSTIQTVDKSVEAYICKISEEQANVDAYAHLIDTECRFGYFIVTTVNKANIPLQINGM